MDQDNNNDQVKPITSTPNPDSTIQTPVASTPVSSPSPTPQVEMNKTPEAVVSSEASSPVQPAAPVAESPVDPNQSTQSSPVVDPNIAAPAAPVAKKKSPVLLILVVLVAVIVLAAVAFLSLAG